MDDELDEILLFQSGPMSSNMLADWQIKHAKAAIIAWADKRAEQQVREARIDEIDRIEYWENGGIKVMSEDEYGNTIWVSLSERIANLTNKEQK